MKIICAWCGKVMKKGKKKNGVSHGICKPCMKKFIIEIVEEKR